MNRVPPHRSECPCSSVASACTPEPPTTRRTAHPIRKVPTTAMRCPWPITAYAPSLHVSCATNTSEHATQRSPAHLLRDDIHLLRRACRPPQRGSIP